jgi:hypothetical protein
VIDRTREQVLLQDVAFHLPIVIQTVLYTYVTWRAVCRPYGWPAGMSLRCGSSAGWPSCLPHSAKGIWPLHFTPFLISSRIIWLCVLLFFISFALTFLSILFRPHCLYVFFISWMWQATTQAIFPVYFNRRMKRHFIPKLIVHEYVPTGRRNMRRPRNIWLDEHPCRLNKPRCLMLSELEVVSCALTCWALEPR